MSDRNQFTVWKVLFAVVALLLLADCAHAYVGPGAGLELVGYAMSMAAWVGLAFSALFMYPIYALLRRLRGVKIGVKSAALLVPTSGEHCDGSSSQL